MNEWLNHMESAGEKLQGNTLKEGEKTEIKTSREKLWNHAEQLKPFLQWLT